MMRFKGVASGLVLALLSCGAANADTGWIVNPANLHKYRSATCGTWTECNDQAQTEGAHLVSINSSDEQTWLLDNFGPVTLYWTGLTDMGAEGVFVWTSGEPVTYTNWADGQPDSAGNEDYVAMNWDAGGKWNDMEDGGTTTAIFEIGDEYSLEGQVGQSKSFAVTCTNTTTGQTVTATFRGSQPWDCLSMGLRVGHLQTFEAKVSGRFD